MTFSRARLAFLMLSGCVVAMVAPASAWADTSEISINTGSGWVHDSNTPLLDISALAPGDSRSATLQVRNDAGDPGDLTLTADNIVENENGCMHSEALVDNTCGALQGELGHELVFSVYEDPENDGTFELTPRWTGSLYDLAATPVDVLANLPGGSITGLRLVMTLPASSGNETQTDTVDFSFRFTLTGVGGLGSPGSTSGPGAGGTSGPGSSTGPGAGSTPQGPGSVEVKGVKVVRRHPHTGVLHDITSQLPFTGTPAERLVAAGLWLLITGSALSLLAAKRRGRGAPEY